ncbi:MAG: hypothetical protein ACXVA3_06735 [Vulcanimicrobiaceae bacterium]
MRRRRVRVQRVLLWALLLSIIVHFTVGPYLAALFFQHTLVQFGGKSAAVVTTRITFDHRLPVRPRPRSQPRPVIAQRPRAIVPPHVSAHAVAAAPKAAAAPHRHELLHFEKHAPPRLTSEQIAEQEAGFSKTIAQARAGQDPVAGSTSATVAPEPPAAFKRDLSSFSGVGFGDGYLYPVNSWKADGYDYYYVRYRVTHADGTPEEGVVPWPIRYLPGDDPFVRGVRRIPLPGPLASFQLPADADPKPLVAYCYEHRLQYCPIDHN